MKPEDINILIHMFTMSQDPPYDPQILKALLDLVQGFIGAAQTLAQTTERCGVFISHNDVS